MKIIVCVKQVPSTTEVLLDPVTHTIIRDGRLSIINPFDLHAVEAAVRIKEMLGGEIETISMGIPATERLLRDTIARGADGAMLLSDRKFAGADTLATSYTLSCGIRNIGQFNLILCGKMAVDGDTAQIGPELAEKLSIPHVTDVCEIISATEEEVVCKKLTDDGAVELRVKLPALLTVVRSINFPRLPSIAGVRRSIATEITRMDAASLQADETRCGLSGSATQVVRTFVPKSMKETVTISGSVTEKVEQLLDCIKRETK